MVLADAWYVSGTFWAIAGVGATLVGILVTVWVTYVVGVPRRRLYYGLASVTPLLSAPSGMRGDLELRHRNIVLTEPVVLRLRLVSRGRRDIPSSSYDRGEPISLDVGVPILEILQTNSDAESIPEPVVKVDGSALEIGPALIGKRHTLTYTLLVDTPDPQLTCRASLIDVQVQRSSPDIAAAIDEDLLPRLAMSVFRTEMRLLPLVGALVGGTVLGLLTHPRDLPPGLGGPLTFVGAMSGSTTLMMMALQRLTRKRR